MSVWMSSVALGDSVGNEGGMCDDCAKSLFLKDLCSSSASKGGSFVGLKRRGNSASVRKCRKKRAVRKESAAVANSRCETAEKVIHETAEES